MGYDCVSECVRVQESVILLSLVRVKDVLRKKKYSQNFKRMYIN